MSRILKSFLSKSIQLISKIFTYSLLQRIKSRKAILYTLWIKNFIGNVGEHSYIYYPCKLEGGGNYNITIGYNTYIQGHSVLGCWKKYGVQVFSPSISIGNNCNIGEYMQISACNRVIIGNGLLAGRYIYIGDNSHGGLSLEESSVQPDKRDLKSKGEIIIGDNVWIGDKVTILGGVTIGDNVIIGANSVVTHNLPSNSVAVGAPAKVINSL